MSASCLQNNTSSGYSSNCVESTLRMCHTYSKQPAVLLVPVCECNCCVCVCVGGAKPVRESPGLRRGKKQGQHHPMPQTDWRYFYWAPRWVPGCNCNTRTHTHAVQFLVPELFLFVSWESLCPTQCPLSYNWMNHFYNIEVTKCPTLRVQLQHSFAGTCHFGWVHHTWRNFELLIGQT